MNTTINLSSQNQVQYWEERVRNDDPSITDAELLSLDGKLINQIYIQSAAQASFALLQRLHRLYPFTLPCHPQAASPLSPNMDVVRQHSAVWGCLAKLRKQKLLLLKSEAPEHLNTFYPLSTSYEHGDAFDRILGAEYLQKVVKELGYGNIVKVPKVFGVALLRK